MFGLNLPNDKLAQAVQMLKQIKAHYFDNFWADGALITNNPERAGAAELPRFRLGVCETETTFGWTEINRNNRYISPLCTDPASRNLPAAKPEKYQLQSVALLPLYIGSGFITAQKLSPSISSIARQYKDTGKLPSRPSGNITVGYDYGLLLYNLVETNHPLAIDVYRKMLAQLDSAGSWVEYYEDTTPKGCRYRPWESAINLEAALHFASKYQKSHKK